MAYPNQILGFIVPIAYVWALLVAQAFYRWALNQKWARNRKRQDAIWNDIPNMANYMEAALEIDATLEGLPTNEVEFSGFKDLQTRIETRCSRAKHGRL